MFKLLTIKDYIEIPPKLFGKPLKQAALEALKAKFEDLIDEKLGYLIQVVEVKEASRGKIVRRNPSTIHKVVFTVLTFKPELQEILNGKIIDITEFGVFVRIGPADGLIHVSQVMDDYVDYDKMRGALIGREKGKIIEIGDDVRARIISVGKLSGVSMIAKQKISLTMRQPGLGKIEWLKKGGNENG